MRLKSVLWAQAYIRRCQVAGLAAVVRRHGADEAGAIFVVVNRLDGTGDLYGPAPQSAFASDHSGDRMFSPCLRERPAPDAAIEAYLAKQIGYDPDLWILEVEDRAGRHNLDHIVV